MRSSLPLVTLAAAVALTLTGCGSSQDAPAQHEPAAAPEASTGGQAAQEQPADHATTTAAVDGAGSGDHSDLPAVAAAFAEATSEHDQGRIWELSCDGVRAGMDRQEFAERLALSPRRVLSLQAMEVSDGPLSSDVLPDPGGEVTRHALATYDARAGSGEPETTFTVRLTHTDEDGWRYCGALPE